MSKKPVSERNIKVFNPEISDEEFKDKKKRKLRTAAYCRVSTDSKEQEVSYDSQVTYYRKLIDDNDDWDFVGIYADPAVSGTSRRHRIEFDRMIYDCMHGKIDQIITKSMSRFSRNKLDTLAVIRLLSSQKRPVRIIFEDDHISSDDLSAEIIVTITSMLAEQESANKSNNVKWGFERRIEQGHYLTPTTYLLGYDKTQEINKDDREIFIVEEEAKTVRVIFWMFNAGYKVSEIAYELTKAGVPTGKGNLIWNSSSVLGILKNERYCGDVRTNKTYVENYRLHRTIKNNGEKKYRIEEDHHPAIVTREEWQMAQKLIASHKYGYDPYINGSYSLQVVNDGILRGFIPINIHWAGSELDEYIELSQSVQNEKDEKLKKGKVAYFPGFQVVRKQDVSHMGRCALRISPQSIALNTACVDIWETEYLEMLFNPVEKLIAFRAADSATPGALRWKRMKDDKLVPVQIGCSAFTSIVYKLMGWPELWNTTMLMAVYQKGGETVMICDLEQHEINALPYAKPKEKKNRKQDDAYYDIEAMIAQQIELMHNKVIEDMAIEDEQIEEPEEAPPPKRRKLHPKEWADTFGQDSKDAASGCRRFQFMLLDNLNVSSPGVIIPEYDKSVTVSKDMLMRSIDELYGTHDRDEIKTESSAINTTE